MANLVEHALVLRATKWRLDSGYEGCTIYVVREAADTDQAIGYSLTKINAAAEVFGDFSFGAGAYKLDLAADLARSRPGLTCVGAKYLESLTIAASDSENGK